LVHGGDWGTVNKTRLTQVHRALQQLGITEMAAANQYLATQFLPAHNQRFAIPASEAGTAFIPWIGPNLTEILCVQEERVVAKDNTVHYHRQHYRSRRIPTGSIM